MSFQRKTYITAAALERRLNYITSPVALIVSPLKHLATKAHEAMQLWMREQKAAPEGVFIELGEDVDTYMIAKAYAKRGDGRSVQQIAQAQVA